jgi:TRAP-type mannitol/chloroaromatic compound transport system permease small subunit
MITRFLNVVDGISTVLAYVAMAFFLILVGDMLYEVVSRRVFGAPTLWAYDIAYMMNGCLFLLAAAFTLKSNEHIRIDFLSSRFPAHVQDWINAAVYIFLLFPTLAFVCMGAFEEGWSALVTGELEPASSWKPVLWPFYAGIATGFGAFTLQAVAQCIRHIRAALGVEPSPLAVSSAEG